MKTIEQKTKNLILILVLISTVLFIGYIYWGVGQVIEMAKLVQ